MSRFMELRCPRWAEQAELGVCEVDGLSIDGTDDCMCGVFDLSRPCTVRSLHGDIVLERMACVSELRMTQVDLQHDADRLIVREMPDLERIVFVDNDERDHLWFETEMGADRLASRRLRALDRW